MGKISIATLAPFAPCVVNIRGKAAYSHLSKRIEGKDLEEANKKRQTKGLTTDSKPYTAINVEDAYIVDDGKLNPQVKAFFEEKLYSKQNQDGTITNIYYAKSKSPFLPTIAYSKEAGADLAGKGLQDNNVPLKGELANGLDITVGVKLFKTNNGMGVPVGIGIDYVLVNEPVKYYVSPGISDALAAQGLTYQAPEPTSAESVQQTAVPNQPAAPQAMTQAQPQPMQQVTPDATPIAVSPMANVQGAVPQQAQYQQQQAAASPMVNMAQAYPQGGANYAQPQQMPPQQAPTLQYNPN